MSTTLKGMKSLHSADCFTCKERAPVMLRAWTAGPFVVPPVNLWISHPASQAPKAEGLAVAERHVTASLSIRDLEFRADF